MPSATPMEEEENVSATAPILAAAAPVNEKDRIFTLDVLRGFALLGILLMNIQDFSMPGAAYVNPTAFGDLHGANYWVWLFSHLLADEKLITIFSMLFGAGVLLMTGHVEASGRSSAGLHYRRMGWLILFGMLHAHLLWSGDILFSYGVSGLLVFLFRKYRPRTLLIVGVISLTVTPALMTFFGWTMPYWPSRLLRWLREGLWMPSPDSIAEELANFRGGWLTQMGERVYGSLLMQTVYFLIWTFWRVFGLMLIGMALFKLGVLNGKRPPALYRVMIAVAVALGVPVILYGTHNDFATGWDFRKSFFFGMEYNYWASILVAFGWVGLLVLAAQVTGLTPVTRRLAAVGRMAFTNYILDTLICTTIFYGHGFGLFGKVERVGQLGIVIAIWALQLVISPIWLRYFMFGPLEWLWRSLTYWKRAPFRRTQSAQAHA